MVIVLKTELKVLKKLKTTKAMLFRNLIVGSKIRLTVDVTPNKGYAKYMQIENICTGEKISKTFAELPKILECFEFEEKII
jgi:hypothetical protein